MSLRVIFCKDGAFGVIKSQEGGDITANCSLSVGEVVSAICDIWGMEDRVWKKMELVEGRRRSEKQVHDLFVT